jgi:hypothetical protein
LRVFLRSIRPCSEEIILKRSVFLIITDADG